MKDCRLQISVCRCLLAVALVVGLSAPAFAQSQPPQPPPVSPATPAATDGFVPMSEAAPREVLPATPLVFYAYGFVWVALIGYVFLMWRRMARVEQDLAVAQQRLQGGTGGR